MSAFTWHGPAFCEGPPNCPECDETCIARNYQHLHGYAAGRDRPPILDNAGHNHASASPCSPSCPFMKGRR